MTINIKGIICGLFGIFYTALYFFEQNIVITRVLAWDPQKADSYPSIANYEIGKQSLFNFEEKEKDHEER